MQRIFLSLVAAAMACLLPVPGVAAEKPLKIGFVYVSPANEVGWSYTHDQGRKELEKMEGVTTFYTESVPEGADSERVILQMARKNYDIIFTTSFGYMDPTIKVARQFPHTQFLHCSGYKTAENVSTYFGRMYQARYLTGMVAGAMTRKNAIGYVAAFPIPEVIRGINAFTLGVRAVNPKAEVRVMWTRSWYDVASEKEAGKRLVDAGCDVIAQHQDSPGPQEAAEEKGVFSVGYHSDMSAFAPTAHLVAAVWSWGDFYKSVVQQVRAGTWKVGSYWPGIESGIVDISKFGPMVPQAVQDTVMKARASIIKGETVVFRGPVKDQKGAVRIEAGKTPDDKELLGMSWFVQGVVGTTE